MKKKYLIKYSFEFVVIVIGISVSFWLNELSIDNQNELERIKVLNSLIPNPKFCAQVHASLAAINDNII